jgi:hypothetical protein
MDRAQPISSALSLGSNPLEVRRVVWLAGTACLVGKHASDSRCVPDHFVRYQEHRAFPAAY